LIRSKVRELAAEPRGMRKVKKLEECWGYRLRVGDWRVVFTSDQGRLAVVVTEIETRGEV